MRYTCESRTKNADRKARGRVFLYARRGYETSGQRLLCPSVRPVGTSKDRFLGGPYATAISLEGGCRRRHRPMNTTTVNAEKAADVDAGSFTTGALNCIDRANQKQNAGGESVAGCPAQRSVRKNVYKAERLNFTVRGALARLEPTRAGAGGVANV